MIIDSKYKCFSNSKNENWNIKGTSLGGLFVLEPWITPSLFYQFLNQNDIEKIAMDTYSFCKVLGPIEGKRQLNMHFKSWVNESAILSLANKKITHLRIPIGDWMFQPYGPYIGCMEDASIYLNNILDWCHKHSIKVLLDLHGVKDSQNGLDNSGKSNHIQYKIQSLNNSNEKIVSFKHWSIISGDWIGNFNLINKNYSSIHFHNIQFTKKILFQIIDTYKNHDALFGIEPLNEPWNYTPENILKDFYYDIYKYMFIHAPHLKFIYHDSFRANIWDSFLINCKNVAMDWHIYQAWNTVQYGDQFLLEADNYDTYIDTFKKKGINLIIGEYSLATDNCAMWLNGFQDNLDGYPVYPCKFAPCPFPYINVTDLNRIKPIISPIGTGLSSPYMGTCPYEGNLIIDENQNVFLRKLNLKKMKSFSHSQGWFFWNFKTEFQEEIAWSFEKSFDNQLFRSSDFDNGIYSSWNYYYLLGGFLLFFLFFLGGSNSISYFFKKKNKNIKKYQYIDIELMDQETNPINIMKKNASTGSISNHYKYSYEAIK